MFCPNCKYEYREGITVCPDCDSSLVETLPDEADDSLSDLSEESPEIEYAALVPIFTSGNHSDILLVKTALESASIPCFPDQHFDFRASMIPATLLIDADNVESALEIIARLSFSDENDPLRDAEYL